VLRLARKLNALGDECHVLNLNPDVENAELLKGFADLTILHAPLPAPRWLRRTDWRLARLGIDFSMHGWLARRLIERNYLGRYDIFHSHLFKVDWVMAQAKRRHPQTRFVSTLHGDYQLFHESAQGGGGERIPGWKGKMELLRKECDGWVYIADKQAELLTQSYGVPAAKLHKIYNGFEPTEPVTHSKKQNGDGLTFVMVARGIEEKGWDTLISAFQRLDSGSQLLLVGEGPYLDELRARTAPDPRITFVGFHPNPVEVIRDADVFVFPSVYRAESLPTVIMEALYCGVPVISTAIGEVPDMLATPSGQTCGQLIDIAPAEAMVEQLAAAMARYRADPDLLAQHRQLTGAAFEKFDMTVCAEQYRSLYQSVLRGKSLS
jgi:glycosyltransferase involved in cell wall biosynthesis